MNHATRPEVVFAKVMQRAPDLITDEESASLGRFMGNVVHHVGPEWKVYMLSAGPNLESGDVDYVFVGIGKNLPGRIKRTSSASPLPTGAALYTMVSTFKQALNIQKEVISLLDGLAAQEDIAVYASEDTNWYWTPGGNSEVAKMAIFDVAGDHDFATDIYRYEQKISDSALSGLKAKLVAIYEAVEDEVGMVV